MTDPAVLERAAALFNQKLFFECHDLLEEAWAEEHGEEKAFLRALIHISVGLYHLAAGNPQGAVNLLSSGVEGLEPFPARHHGLDVAALREKARLCLGKAEGSLEGDEVSWGASDVPTMSLDTAEKGLG